MRVQRQGGLPEQYEPPWRDVPWLGWVAARAYLPDRLSGLVAGAVASCTLLIWVPIVATMRARRCLAALDRTAMVELALVGRKGRRVVPSLVAVASLVAVFVVTSVPAIVVASFTLRISSSADIAIATGSAVVAVPIGMSLLTMNIPAIIRSSPPLKRTIHAIQSEAPGAPIWRLGSLAAWPQHRGHGRALLIGLLRDRSAGGTSSASPVMRMSRRGICGSACVSIRTAGLSI